MAPDDQHQPAFLSNSEDEFVSEEGDAENVWEATRIIQERKDGYLVEWAGDDPKTRKPWKPSWEPKRNCMAALVKAWKEDKERKALQKKAKAGGRKSQTGSKGRKTSNVSNEARTSSTASGSSTPHARPTSTRKRTRSTLSSTTDPAASDTEEDTPNPPPKRRRTMQTLEIKETSDSELKPRANGRSKGSDVLEEEDSSTERPLAGPSKLLSAKSTERSKKPPLAHASSFGSRSTANGRNQTVARGSSSSTAASPTVRTNGAPRAAAKSMPNLNGPSKNIKNGINAGGTDSRRKPKHPDARESEESTQEQDQQSEGNIFDGANDALTASSSPEPVVAPTRRKSKLSVRLLDPEEPRIGPPRAKKSRSIPARNSPPQASPSRTRSDAEQPDTSGKRTVDDSIVPETTQGTQSRIPSPSPSPPPLPREGSLRGRMRDRTGSLSPGKPSAPRFASGSKGKGRAITPPEDADEDLYTSRPPAKPLGPIPVVTPSKFRPYLRGADEATEAIESFSSPEKETRKPMTSQHESVSERSNTRPTSQDIQKRGRELAAEKEKERRAQRAPTPPKVPLQTIVNPRPAQARPIDQYMPVDEAPVTGIMEDAMVQELEDEFLDFNGGQGDEQDVENGDEEEEEEIVEMALSQGVEPPPEPVTSQVEPGESSQSFDVSSSLLAAPSTAHSSQPSAAQSTAERLRKAEADNARLLRNLEKARTSLESTRTEGEHQRARNTEVIQSLTSTVDELRAGERNLIHELELSRTRIQAMQAEREAAKISSQSPSLPDTQELEKERAATQAEIARQQARAATAEAEATQQQERAATAAADAQFVRAQLHLAQQAADSALADLRAAQDAERLARGQAEDGVRMARGMFEGRIAALEAQLVQARQTHELLVERDARTGDEIRHAAAEAPALREEVVRWKRRAVLAEQESARLAELVEALKEDSKFQPSDEEPGQPQGVEEDVPALPDPAPSQEMSTTERSQATVDEDEKEVYMCLYRDGDRLTACNQVFPDHGEFGAHVLQGHLASL